MNGVRLFEGVAVRHVPLAGERADRGGRDSVSAHPIAVPQQRTRVCCCNCGDILLSVAVDIKNKNILGANGAVAVNGATGVLT